MSFVYKMFNILFGIELLNNKEWVLLRYGSIFFWFFSFCRFFKCFCFLGFYRWFIYNIVVLFRITGGFYFSYFYNYVLMNL